MQVTRKHTFSGHFAAIYCLELMNRGEGSFLSAGGDGHIVQWNMEEPEKGKVIATVEGRVFSLLHLKKANMLVAGDMNGGLHWMEIGQNGAPVGRALHQKGIFALATDVEEKYLYSFGGDGYLGRWSIDTGRATESLQLSGHSLRCYAFSETNDLAAIGASDGHIYLVKMCTLEVVQVLEAAHTASVFSLAWSPNGKFLISGGRDALINVWDAGSGFSEVTSISAHWYTVNDLEMSPSGLCFASASRDKSLKIWKTEDFTLQKVLAAPRFKGHIHSVNRVKWMSDNLLLSAGDDKQIIAWQLDY